MTTIKKILSDVITLKGRRPKPIGKLGVWLYGHRNAVGRGWELIGQGQFKFMCAMGLKPEHVLLDIGCGSLRGGQHFIRYLDAGNYLGIDQQEALIKAGLREEVGEKVEKAKKPEFVISQKFEFKKFTKIPDYSLAQSVFTHLNQSDIQRCISNLRRFVKPGHLFFTNFFEVDQPRNQQERSHPHRCFFYTRQEIIDLANQEGWNCEYMGDWGRVRPHKWIKMMAK